MSDVFAARYDLLPVDPEADVIASFVDELGGWLKQRWAGAPRLTAEAGMVAYESESFVVRWEPFDSGEDALYELTVRHRDDEGPIEWSTQVSLYRARQRWTLSLRVSNNGPAPGEPGHKPTTRPKLLLSLSPKFRITYNNVQLRPEARVLYAREVPDFVRWELFEASRLPIVVVTKNSLGDFVANPTEIARASFGTCEVVALADVEATYRLTDHLGRRALSCFKGAARVYMPGFSSESDPLKHPLLFPPRLKQRGAAMQLATALSLFMARRYSRDENLLRLRDKRAVAAATERARMQSRLHSAAASAASAEEWKAIAEQLDGELQKERFDSQQLRERLSKLAEEVTRIETKNKALSHALRARGETVESDEVTIPEYDPETMEEVVLLAQDYLDEDLVVLPSALSAAQDSPYIRPKEVLEGLKALAELVRITRAGPLGMTPKDFFAQRGLDYAPSISSETRARYGSEYRFPHNSSTVECVEHLKWGNSYSPELCCRVYFARPSDGNQAVVGHVGRHLTSATTS